MQESKGKQWMRELEDKILCICVTMYIHVCVKSIYISNVLLLADSTNSAFIPCGCKTN